ncbi:hypothetical protein [Pseudomonas delhiensis]|uniref:hypothetical protein n=1 Tax=Pseudomonas delhiensis TaxID=366289 RepID=UPI00315AC347
MNPSRLIIASCLSAISLLSIAVAAQSPENFLQGRVYELRRSASPPSCFEWASGLPNGVWGNAGDYAAETAVLSDNGEVLVASAIYKPTGEKVSHRFYKSRAACREQLPGMPEATSGNSTTSAPAAAESHVENPGYVERLQRDFGARLHYSSAMAEEIVRKINIDCRSRDGRYLPLYNVLLARLDEANEADAWMETRIVDSGNNIMVYDSIHLKSGKQFEPRLTLEINEWGGVKMHDVRRQALSNACFGAYGPIWKF